MNKINTKTQEYLSHDILDEEFVRIFILINRVQMLLGSCRVHLKDRFVTSPTLYQKIYTIMCIITCIVFYYMLSITFFNKFIQNVSLYYLLLAISITELIAYVLNMVHVRFVIGEASSEFYIKLQTVDRLMKINLNKRTYTLLHRMNLTSVLFLVTLFMGLFVALISEIGTMTLTFFWVIVCHLTFLIEITNCSNIIVHLFIYMRHLNSIISNHLKPKLPTETFKNVLNKNYMRDVAAKFNDFELDETDVYLQQAYECFDRFQNVYKFEVFLFCSKSVTLNLLVFEFILYGIQQNLLEYLEIIVIATYAMIYFIAILILGTRFELLFREVKETKRLAIEVMIQYQEGPLREKARRMLKLLSESPPCFSVYGIWHMNAQSSVKIFVLISSLILTLLQFQLL